MLATFAHPNHIVYLCLWDSLTGRLPATPNSLDIDQNIFCCYFNGVISITH
ncbi:hypothetical protein VAE151_630671 [Vibrio aestuarianus]|uniref:Uncharacterized protein n=1 Tax=Vibrio aestuarianus TaxID=28171 RepID=A0ABM9FJ03_9VIBR|nr:hypothetical protein VAE063_1010145 [Vibrio aestuarianus]CAH8226378.1 hypothetical protein VIBAE_B10756 [Vibrio aestuarianus subsp. francensis]CAH8223460.1 hypothetical protein VAE308_1270023 [Vibrio aestuarianus]CAH8228127.1 hypothetical protein VAE032_330146 [Vibrio aestuarianus]CAH8228155.1 hypothetical protein VAE128_500664 [Vibrio aestuarianus]